MVNNPKRDKNKPKERNLKEITAEVIKKFGILPDKDLGQNFLVDEKVLEKISESANISPDDFVIEIGPGLGSLTDKLSKKSGKLILIEYDSFLSSLLDKELSYKGNIIVINEDALKTDYRPLIQKYRDEVKMKNLKVVSNLPYYITTEIITRLVCEIPDCNLMIFTIQKEAAEKISSVPGSKTFSVISALVSYYFKSEIIMDVPPEAFIPQPGVTSSVLTLKRREDLPDDGITPGQYLKVLKASFSQRRKTISNSLGSSGIVAGGKSRTEDIMTSLGISKTARPQEISSENYRKIACIIYNSDKSIN